MDGYDLISYSFWTVVIGAFVFAIVYFSGREKERNHDILRLAIKNDWEYSKCDARYRNTHLHLKTFQAGIQHFTVNVINGRRDDIEFVLADYTYVLMAEQPRNMTVDQTVCFLVDPSIRLPHFFLRRKRPIIDAVGKLFGGKDIAFSDDSAFSTAFVLQGANEDSAREFFNPQIRKAFLQFANSDIQVEAWKDFIVVHRCSLLPVEKWKSLLADSLSLHQVFKQTAALNPL